MSVIDACCLINVCAVEDYQQWLAKLGLQWYLPDAVLAEMLYLHDTDEEGNRIRHSLDLQTLIDVDVLQVCTVASDDEIRCYVDLAAELDDGEAMALAIASCRAWVLATDDRKARRLATELNVSVITTPELIKLWVDKVNPSDTQIQYALQCIREHARFMPSRREVLYDWWLQFLTQQ